VISTEVTNDCLQRAIGMTGKRSGDLKASALVFILAEDSTKWHYYLDDGQFSVRHLVNSDGALSLSRTHDPFGLVLHEEGNGKAHFGFAGSQAGGMGLLYVGGRYFDPRTGRFLSPNNDNFDPRRPGTHNPYLSALFLLPLLVVVARKDRRRSKHIAIGLLGLSLVLTTTGCEPPKEEDDQTSTPNPAEINTPPPTSTNRPTPTNTAAPTPSPSPTPGPTNTPSSMPSPAATCTPTPTTTPTPQVEQFRITSQKIAQAGSMANYLRTEPEEMVLARIAIGEGEAGNILDQEYIMWTVKARSAIGFAKGGGIRGRIVPPTTINEEALNGNAYHVIQGILSWTSPEVQPCHWNLTRMTHPCDERHFQAFERAYYKAQMIVASSIHDMPEPVHGYESFASSQVSRPGQYCTEGDFEPGYTRRHQQLAGATVFRDCYLNDNNLLGLGTIEENP
jgi:RHS repeat-associated protein